MRVRRDKRARLIESGSSAYPVTIERTDTLADIRARYDDSGLEPDSHTGEKVAVVGRVMFLRNTGKLCFVRLREGDGAELQVMLSLADLGEESLADFKATVDLGDLLAVRGEVVTSRRGELSVQAGAWSMAAKTLATPAQRAQAALRRGARAAALRRHDGPRRAAPDGAQQSGRLEVTARDPRPTGVRRGRDADPPAHQRRRCCPPLQDPPQCSRPGDAAPDRARARSQEGDDRRRRPGVRDRPYLPQRRHRLHPRGGVLDARGLSGLRRPAHHDRPGQGVGPGRPRRDRPAHGPRPRRERDRPARRVAGGADPRAGLRGGRHPGGRGHRRRDASHPRRQARRGAPRRMGRRPRSWWSCSSSSSRTP